MTLNLKMPHPEPDLKPRITVVGVGGAGGNAVNNMIANNLGGVEFVVANTDAQALAQSRAERKIQLGRNITQGLGAGSRPDVGRAAAEEAIEDIIEHIQRCNMVFITAGMGGGTGTGAAPVVARASREQGILTVGVITKPFQFEGLNRMRIAEEGIEELQHYVDTLIIIPNQNLFRVANEKTTFAQAFQMADNVLHSGVRGVTDLMVMPGLINLDFADVRQVMSEMGKAMMGTGEAESDNRAVAAAEAAISNPLLDDVSMEGAKGVLINITGGLDMTLFEVDEAANRIRSEVDPDANIIFGSTFDESLDGKMRISVIATGIDAEVSAQPKPRMISLVTDNTRAGAPGPAPAQAAGLGIPPRAGSGAGAARDGADGAGTEPVLDLDARAAEEAAREGETEGEEAAAAARMDRGGGIHADAEKPFLPPPPIEGPEPSPSDRSEHRPDPMAEAEFLNAGRERARAPERKGPSLFERMTGTGRARILREQADRHAEPSLGAAKAAPEPAAEAVPEPGRGPQPPSAAAPAQQQPLGGLESRPAKERGLDEEVLEIPAFLRRQAN